MNLGMGGLDVESSGEDVRVIIGILENLPMHTAPPPPSSLDSDDHQDFYSLDATSYYMFGKMLAD